MKIAPDVYLVKSEAGLHEVITDFLNGKKTYSDPVGLPSTYPCVIFLYLKYHGGDDYVVVRAVPVADMLKAIKVV